MRVDRELHLRFANIASLKFAGAKREDVIAKKKCYDIFKLSLCRTADCPVNRAWTERKMIAGESFASRAKHPNASSFSGSIGLRERWAGDSRCRSPDRYY